MAGYEEASQPQLDYIKSLADQVVTQQRLNAEGKLNRYQAGAAIDALLLSLGKTPKSNVVAITSAKSSATTPLGNGTEEGFFFEEEEEELPPKPPWQIEQEEYNQRQWGVFTQLERVGQSEYSWKAARGPMEYRGRPVVYQRWPHKKQFRTWADRHTGWAWTCAHPAHKHPVHGGSSYGWYATLLGAERHAIKHNRKGN
jgi:hypothetical protein